MSGRQEILSLPEKENAKAAFKKVAGERKTIDMWEMREALQQLQNLPSEEEFVDLLAFVDPHGQGVFTLNSFLSLLEKQKETILSRHDNDDATRLAFVAMGGNPDKTGQIATSRLAKTITEFGLPVDLDRLVHELDTDGSGYVDFQEFRKLF
ncbi:putative flagellar outer dynein arm light chain 5 [Paratrimastix pyriformis]|uniref:Flagellar outer dynein arm light chain 5 n=1 Tax=Paratrimastix pyriformis TaxID=342808 RepID=A0ABQ8UUM6_9EUKA|nr:putative flagellar outer dynein arm light chain 5 [Paratrimastix pyriformis]